VGGRTLTWRGIKGVAGNVCCHGPGERTNLKFQSRATRSHRELVYGALVLAFAALVTACGSGGGGGGGGGTVNPPPSITSISPTSATAGGSAFTLTVNGKNFTTSCVVLWNTSQHFTTFVNNSQLTVAISASDIASPGTVEVRVRNPNVSTDSNVVSFAVNEAVPVLTSISPSSASAGSLGLTLTVMGSGFLGNSVVNWNGSPRVTTFVSSGQLTATILASDVTTGGSAQVTVFNPPPGGGTSNALTFTITSAQPTITSLSPATTVAGRSAFTLTVNGFSFSANSTVQWNGSPPTTTFVSSNQLTAAIPASDVASAGTFPVTVVTSGFADSNSLNFTVTATSSLLITTTSLPPSSGGKDYYFVLASTGGVGALTWTVTNGSLPAGLTLDASSGLISGAVTGVNSNFTVQATDSAVPPNTGVQDLSITVTSLGRNDQVCISPGVPGPDAATPISNGTLRASISPYGDVDTYSFTLTQTATNLSIETFAQRLNIGNNLFVQSDFLDTVTELLDSSCTVIALNDDIVLGTTRDSRIQIGPTPFPSSPPSNPDDLAAPNSLPAGTYYIRIRDYRGDGRPDLIYDLTVSGIK
jgi:IPT/TIG domain/Putative Ig domain